MPRVVRTLDELHDHHHALIADRKRQWKAIKGRTGIVRVRRREAFKRYWWTLTGHLRGQHFIRGQAPFLNKTEEEVEAWHDRLHEPASGPAPSSPRSLP